MNWTAERVSSLTQLWKNGESASIIAGKLGGFSHCVDGGRSSVIGKANRLGLPSRATTTRTTQPTRKRPVSREAANRRPNAALSPAAEIIKAIRNDSLPLPEPKESDIARVSLQDADENACRWPCAEPDAASRHELFFCGAPKARGLVYCYAHAARAFAMPQPRRPSSPPLRLVEVANA